MSPAHPGYDVFMGKPTAQARSTIASGGEKVKELAWTVGRDRRKEARLQRRWGLLQVALGAVFALAARRVAERVWVVLTGEEPPLMGHAGEPADELAQKKDSTETASPETSAPAAPADRTAENSPSEPTRS